MSAGCIMDAFMTGLGFAGLIGVYAAYAAYQRSKKPAPTPPPKPSREEERYGHPRPPVSALRSRLPAPPQDHVWETTVKIEADGYIWMHLSLVNLLTGAVVATTKRDLTNEHHDSVGGQPIYRTWARQYAAYPTIKDKTFNNDLIGPVVDWAVKAVNKTRTGQVLDYRLE